MAHILFISRYYWPEKAGAAVCVHETTRRLAEMGHQITVLTTVPNYPSGIVPQAYRGHMLQKETVDNVSIVRAWSYTSENKGFLKRIVSQLSFGCLAPLLAGKAVGKPDLIIVESPPLFNVIAAHVLAWWKRCPFLFWVADLWPESAIQLGVLHNPLLIALSQWLEQVTYRRARTVWAVTEGMRATLMRYGLAPERILLITNGVDTVKFQPGSQQQARCELGWDQRFTVLYAGTHGLSHGLTSVLDAATRIQHREDIRFVFAGTGAEKADLVALARRRELKNVVFLDAFPHEQMPLVLAAADVCLAHTRKLPIFEGMLPIKMYEAMACGRPLIVGLNGEARQIAEREARAALYVEPENAEALADAVCYLFDHPEVAALLGQQGRRYVCEHFDYDTLTARVDAHLKALLFS